MNRSIFITQGLVLSVAGMILLGIEYQKYGANEIPRTTAEAVIYLMCALVILTGYVLGVIGAAMPRK